MVGGIEQKDGKDSAEEDDTRGGEEEGVLMIMFTKRSSVGWAPRSGNIYPDRGLVSHHVKTHTNISISIEHRAQA